jgi:acyl-CoA reductase-like NAD-dependent aldehyde dehydrogenase
MGAATKYDPPHTPEPTPLDEVDAAVVRVHGNAKRWVRTPIAQRISLLRACMDKLAACAEDWALATNRNRALANDEPEGSEPWLSELWPTMRSLRLLVQALEASGEPRLPKVYQRPSGQHVARVYPCDKMDALLFRGFTAEVWVEKDKPLTQGSIYREPNPAKEARLSLILGAGNVGSICPTDALSKLFVEDEVVIIKTNPVNAYLGDYWAQTLQPLIDVGYVAIVHGAAEVGIHLCNHELVDNIHITGSDKTYDAIVWGGDPDEQAKNKAAGDRVNPRHVSAELGCVTPVFVVPGKWSASDLEFQARNIAGMITNNASFNCVAAKAVVTATGWPQRDAFWKALKKALENTPSRRAYYPGAEARYQAFLDAYPDAQPLGEREEGVVPWTLLPRVPGKSDEYALCNEAFCGVVGQIDLDADDAAAFLERAVQFGNETVWGTLSCTLIIDPATAKAQATELDNAIEKLNYGAVSVNIWSGVAFGIASPPWGAAPGATPEDIQSGVDFVHNTYLIDHPSKTVLKAPFRIRPYPAWLLGHRNALAVGRKIFAMEHRRSWLRLPSLIASALAS